MSDDQQDDSGLPEPSQPEPEAPAPVEHPSRPDDTMLDEFRDSFDPRRFTYDRLRKPRE